MVRSDTLKAQNYFERVPKQWDALYSHEDRFRNRFNRLFRRGLYKRYKLTFENIGDLEGSSVLDIGCGTGRYSIECALRGATRVLGIDVAPSMVEFSQNMAEQMRVTNVCQFVCGDILDYSVEEHYDVILACGFFDYIKDAQPLFNRIAELKPRKFVASFPKFTPIWGIQRIIRYYLIKKCPIYNYSQKKLENLYTQAQFDDFRILPCHRGYFGVAWKDDRNL